ncbi:MAG: 30S ribosomal protein S8 [Planctomycetes bacterium RIFCSPHIGHO2_02_FULL_38_41]|nr:MAG: 30S ribosomal protein S8 [Planctomycetes bacterium RIFCSPHIGHO2_02_FULL_38_41]
MCITDPISDMFTSIRNANMILRESVDVSSSKIKKAILKVLKDEGYIKDYKEVSVDSNKSTIRIYLKYGPLKQRVLNNIERVSKCSRRIYKQGRKVTKVMGGFGTAIYSTSKGIISDKECRALKIGGELLCVVS